MTQPQVHTSPALQIRRTFNAPADLVFQAWTDASMLSQWFARAPGTPPGIVVHSDPRPGGVYVVDVVSPEDGLTYRMQGRYTEVQPPARLTFTWWHDRADYGPSLVTVEFRSVGASTTEVILTHEQLPARMEDAHRQGWAECFDMLGRVLQS